MIIMCKYEIFGRTCVQILVVLMHILYLLLLFVLILCYFNLLTPELNPSAQRCVTRYFTGDFAS
jgi:hypothetical protein